MTFASFMTFAYMMYAKALWGKERTLWPVIVWAATWRTVTVTGQRRPPFCVFFHAFVTACSGNTQGSLQAADQLMSGFVAHCVCICVDWCVLRS